MSNDAYISSLSAIAASEGVLERVEAEFSAVVRAIDANEDLRSKLADELLPIAVRQQIVEKLLERQGPPSDDTIRFTSPWCWQGTRSSRNCRCNQRERCRQ